MIYRFDEFELDVDLFEFRQGGRVCELTRKGFDLLHYMLRHAGTTVTKEQLYSALWKEEHVHHSTLPVHVRRVRKALGQSAALVKTIRGVGYQITCSVEVVGGSENSSVPPKSQRGERGPLDDVARLNGLLYLGLLFAEPRIGGELLRLLTVER